jgi:hypothetical protein
LLDRNYSRLEVEQILKRSEGRSVSGVADSRGHTFQHHVLPSNAELALKRMNAARAPSDPLWASAFVNHSDAVTAAFHLLASEPGRKALSELERGGVGLVRDWTAIFPVQIAYRLAHGTSADSVMRGSTNSAHIMACADGREGLHVITCYPLLPGGVTSRQLHRPDYK